MYKIKIFISIIFTLLLNYFNRYAYAENIILLDPGHTKINYGTKSCSGGVEYQYNNEMIDFIEEYLKRHDIQIQKTRSADQEISLKGRTKNSLGKLLFISIHHDSTQEQFISYKTGNPCSNYASGYSIFVSQKNKYFNKSLEYAKLLGSSLRKRGLTPTMHHAEKIKGENREIIDKELGIYLFDDLVVLRTAQCPAVLFESGVIINPDDDLMVKSEEYRSKVAQSILEMVNITLLNKNKK